MKTSMLVAVMLKASRLGGKLTGKTVVSVELTQERNPLAMA